jgi:hypothetical protein
VSVSSKQNDQIIFEFINAYIRIAPGFGVLLVEDQFLKDCLSLRETFCLKEILKQLSQHDLDLIHEPVILLFEGRQNQLKNSCEILAVSTLPARAVDTIEQYSDFLHCPHLDDQDLCSLLELLRSVTQEGISGNVLAFNKLINRLLNIGMKMLAYQGICYEICRRLCAICPGGRRIILNRMREYASFKASN